MLVDRVVDGKKAIVAFLDDQFEPCDEAEATLVKVILEDGGRMFLSPDSPLLAGEES